MKKEIELSIPPDKILDNEFLREKSATILRVSIEEIRSVQTIRRSLDARSKFPIYRIKALVYINENPVKEKIRSEYKNVEKSPRIIVVGMGPAGMFASLRLIELGFKPVILERGKDVRARRFDLKDIQQKGIVNPNSNYCFGEGGAGTYSDGKLYTRSTKRGDVGKILQTLVNHGAQEEILIDAHPHIGSNKLPKVIQSIRETILNFGGEIHFESPVTDFIVQQNTIRGVVINGKEEIFGEATILATGHSARDIFYLLEKHNILLEAKPFAMGVRIEHPQALIDEIQYHTKSRDQNLPASSYNLNCQIDDHGVYSFCMCPGGIIIPASTANEELVLNGMSVSHRNSPFANSGFVISVDERDWKKYESHGEFAGLEFQKEVERIAFKSGGNSEHGQRAGAQRITDFAAGKTSSSLPKSSYIPGTVSAPLHELLPPQIANGLRKSLQIFDKKMKGYFTEEAQILAAETRTSSPIRIPRDPEAMMHVQVKGLFPSGEGAGYAGGIVSSAIDGERCADSVAKYVF